MDRWDLVGLEDLQLYLHYLVVRLDPMDPVALEDL